MVLREGAETVLMLAAVSLNSSALLSFLGTLLGVLAAIAFGVMFVKGSVRINLQKFFRVTTAIMFLVAAQLLISGLHELSESGILPSSKREMAIIGPIVSNDWFFFVTIFALAALMVLFEAKRREPVAAVGFSGGAAQGDMECAAGTAVDGFGDDVLVCVYRADHRGVCVCQERQQPFAGDGSDVCQWAREYSAGASCRWRPASLSGAGEWDGDPLLALSEAGWKDCDCV